MVWVMWKGWICPSQGSSGLDTADYPGKKIGVVSEALPGWWVPSLFVAPTVVNSAYIKLMVIQTGAHCSCSRICACCLKYLPSSAGWSPTIRQEQVIVVDGQMVRARQYNDYLQTRPFTIIGLPNTTVSHNTSPPRSNRWSIFPQIAPIWAGAKKFEN